MGGHNYRSTSRNKKYRLHKIADGLTTVKKGAAKPNQVKFKSNDSVLVNDSDSESCQLENKCAESLIADCCDKVVNDEFSKLPSGLNSFTMLQLLRLTNLSVLP